MKAFSWSGGRLLLGLLGLALVGCSSPRTPTLRVASTQFEGVFVEIAPISVSLLLKVKVEATNPNGFDLKVRAVRGKLLLAEQHEMVVQLQPETWLPSEQTTLFDVPVEIPVKTAANVLRDMITRNITCIPYKFDGEVDLLATSTLKLERDNYPLHKAACLPREQLVQAIKRQIDRASAEPVTLQL